jgi:hypothetical protein
MSQEEKEKHGPCPNKPFMFGHSYTGSGPLLYYMVRIRPFSFLSFQLQKYLNNYIYLTGKGGNGLPS